MNWAIRGDKEPDDNKQFEWVSVKEYKELAKYKRAFEILKDRLMLKIYEEEYHYKQLYTLESSKEVRIDKEEYELLEELMKDE